MEPMTGVEPAYLAWEASPVLLAFIQVQRCLACPGGLYLAAEWPAKVTFQPRCAGSSGTSCSQIPHGSGSRVMQLLVAPDR